MATDDRRRIEKLEDELKTKTKRIEELREEIDEQRDLIKRLEEHADDFGNCLERWKEAFEMEQNEDGAWGWGSFITESHVYKFFADEGRKEHNELVRMYNELARKWNMKLLGGNPVGRPLLASEAQIVTVLKLREAGTSLRNIADETGLGVNTVRTIVDKKRGAGRTARRAEMLSRKIGELDDGWLSEEDEIKRTADDRQKAVKWKRQKRSIDALPQQVQRVVEEGQALIKEAKGLGRSR